MGPRKQRVIITLDDQFCQFDDEVQVQKVIADLISYGLDTEGERPFMNSIGVVTGTIEASKIGELQTITGVSTVSLDEKRKAF